MPTFAIVDTAFSEGLHLRLLPQQTRMWSLFEGTPEHALVEIAPWLVALDGASARAVSLLLEAGQRHPCLTWLCSDWPVSDLAAQLRRWHTVRLQDGGSLVLRWYDTRVQAALLDILDEEQRLMFFGGISRWSFCDRFGEWQPVALPQSPEHPAMSDGPIELSSTQFSALLEVSQPDVVLQHLAEVLPDETSRCDPRALYTLVKERVQQAMSLGWHGLDDQVQFLMPSFYSSGMAAQEPEFVRTMHAPAGVGSSSAGLADRVQALSDVVWSCGKPLWETAPAQSVNGSGMASARKFPDAV